MFAFYIIALIPLLIGGILWIVNPRISWQEWIGASVFALILAVIFNIAACIGMTADVESWSGKITSAKHFSSWLEYYEYAVYRTETYRCGSDSKGHAQYCTRQVFDHWASSTRWHEEYWECYSDINTTYQISSEKFQYFIQKYKNLHSVPGTRYTSDHNSRMLKGDPNDYAVDWHVTQWIEPITTLKHWSNKIKAAPSVFSFVKVPTNIPVFNWPENSDPFHSERVLGTARQVINDYQWDKLNAILGTTKKVNLIIVGFNSDDAMLGQYQKAKWIGGKKNDVVITFGGNPSKPSWCFVFGWTDSEFAKQNISSYIIQNGITTNLYTNLQNEITLNYKIKNWHQFDYLKVEPAARYYYWYFGILVVVQVGLYIWFNCNDFDKTREEEKLLGKLEKFS